MDPADEIEALARRLYSLLDDAAAVIRRMGHGWYDPLLPDDDTIRVVMDFTDYEADYERLEARRYFTLEMHVAHALCSCMISCIIDPTGDVIINLDDFGELEDVPRQGHDQSTVEKYTKMRPRKRLECSFDQPQCTICLEDFSPNTEVRQLNCQHMYHHDCLMGWMKHNKTCPLCLRDLTESPEKSAVASVPRRSRRLRGLSPLRAERPSEAEGQ